MNLKSTLGYALIIIVLILNIGCDGKTPVDLPQAKTKFYENTDFNIKVYYPSDWDVLEKYEDGNAVFKSPNEGIYDFRKYVTIGIDDLSQNPYSLDEYTNLYVNAITEAHKDNKDFEILEIVPFALDGNEGKKVIFRVATAEIEYGSLPKETRMKILRIWTIKNNIAYIFSYVSEEENYDDFIDEANRMINSFKIT